MAVLHHLTCYVQLDNDYCKVPPFSSTGCKERLHYSQCVFLILGVGAMVPNILGNQLSFQYTGGGRDTFTLFIAGLFN